MAKFEIDAQQSVKVTIDSSTILKLLRAERVKLAGRWDTIIPVEGKYHFYRPGYGSRDIGEELGPEVPQPILELWMAFLEVENVFHTGQKN